MGYWLCALLWGLVLLEEVREMPLPEWKAEGMKNVLQFRRTRTRSVYLLALAAGAISFSIELSMAVLKHSAFDLYNLVALSAVLGGGYVGMVMLKGKR